MKREEISLEKFIQMAEAVGEARIELLQFVFDRTKKAGDTNDQMARIIGFTAAALSIIANSEKTFPPHTMKMIRSIHEVFEKDSDEHDTPEAVH